MLAEIGFVLAMVAVVVIAARISDHARIPEAALLTIVGLGYALLPGPKLHLDPEFVLDVILPPLLYHAALGSSLLAIRARLRSVVNLSVLLVLVTALAIGGLLSWLVPVVPLAAAVALGAAVAPPDPVAALAVGRKAGLPGRLSTLIEGEGLLNDAVALTTYQVAIAVAIGGGFSFPTAAGKFVLAVVGGFVVGVLVAFLVRVSRRWLVDPLSVNAVSLATPFLAYTVGELVHGSGVLAVVIAGLIIGHQNPRLQTGASRIQYSAMWRLVSFLLEGFVFLLIGQQLPAVISGLRDYSLATIIGVVGVTVGVVILLRPLWLTLTHYFSGRRGKRDDAISGKEIMALSWSGTRGVITLAAAFGIPTMTLAGQQFPARDLLLFAAYVVVLVTLLIQGSTFGPLLRKLGLGINVREQAKLRNQARLATIEAAQARVDQLVEEENLPEPVAEDIRRGLTVRAKRYQRRLDYLGDVHDELYSPSYEAAAKARHDILDAQRQELLRWRDAGRLPDDSLRILQRELDHEEHTLPVPGNP